MVGLFLGVKKLLHSLGLCYLNPNALPQRPFHHNDKIATSDRIDGDLKTQFLFLSNHYNALFHFATTSAPRSGLGLRGRWQ
jgi:hypothetical protein